MEAAGALRAGAHSKQDSEDIQSDPMSRLEDSVISAGIWAGPGLVDLSLKDLAQRRRRRRTGTRTLKAILTNYKQC